MMLNLTGNGGVWARRIGLVTGCAVFGLLTANAAFAAFYQGRIYPGVEVANVQVGGLTRSEARSRLAERVAGYTLKVTAGDKTYLTPAADLGAEYDLETTLEDAFLIGRGHTFDLVGWLSEKHGLKQQYSYSMNRAKLRLFVNQLVGSTGIQPIDASVVVTNGQTSVQPDKDGRAIDKLALTSQAEESFALASAQPLALHLSDIKADVRVPDTAQAIAEAQQIMAIPLVLKYNDRQFVASRADIGSWLSFTKTRASGRALLKPGIDVSKLKNYVQTLANQVNQAPVNKIITVENGVTTQTTEGKDGLAMDQDQVTSAISQALNQRKSLALAVPTKPVAFKTTYNRTVSLDYGRYIEVNLSKQHLWAYQDHKLVFESPITSGATGAGFGTATGLFSIYYKTTNTHLVGYQYGWNYDVAVQYWMPFYKGYGIHDASWRSAFGGQDYYYGGSHGCVNTPLATSAWIYGWADIGTPVWVHT